MNKKESLRRQEIKKLIYVVIFTFFIGTIALLVFLLNNNTKYIEYSEKSDVDYKVLLKENEFYSLKGINDNQMYLIYCYPSNDATFQYYKITDKSIADMTAIQYNAILIIADEIQKWKSKKKPMVVI